MIDTSDVQGRHAQIAELFVQTFTASEGEDEGALIGGLVRAPLPLGQPEGWIGQSLTGKEIMALRGPCPCVSVLSDPVIW
ncbi:hypothetical protein [Roseovarius sp.]